MYELTHTYAHIHVVYPNMHTHISTYEYTHAHTCGLALTVGVTPSVL